MGMIGRLFKSAVPSARSDPESTITKPRAPGRWLGTELAPRLHVRLKATAAPGGRLRTLLTRNPLAEELKMNFQHVNGMPESVVQAKHLERVDARDRGPDTVRAVPHDGPADTARMNGALPVGPAADGGPDPGRLAAFLAEAGPPRVPVPSDARGVAVDPPVTSDAARTPVPVPAFQSRPRHVDLFAAARERVDGELVRLEMPRSVDLFDAARRAPDSRLAALEAQAAREQPARPESAMSSASTMSAMSFGADLPIALYAAHLGPVGDAASTDTVPADGDSPTASLFGLRSIRSDASFRYGSSVPSDTFEVPVRTAVAVPLRPPTSPLSE